MGRLLVAFLALIPLGAHGQIAFGPSLTGTTSVVNDGAGNQTDPHVSCDNVAYTSESSGASEIRFHDLSTQADSAVPNEGGNDSLSDVSGTRIVFTRAISGQSGIYVYDVATPATPAYEVDPQVGSARRGAAIGGQTVAWQDFGYTPSMLESEIVVHDLLAGASTRLTDDAALDRSPAVSPEGDVVVFEKCDATGAQCDIYRALRSGGVWSAPTALTGPEGEESLPDTNGSVVVYGSLRVGERDIYFQPVSGGVEQRLVLPGEDTNPNVSGSLIAFEHLDVGAFNRDLIVFDISTSTAYRLTSTPSLDETLNDISVCPDGLVRIVYTVREGVGSATNANVYAFSFRLSEPPPPCANGTCEDPGTRPLVATLKAKRTTGAPNQASTAFSAASGPGLLCVDNAGATSGWVLLNGDAEVCPGDFKKSTTRLQRAVPLAAQNQLSTVIAGKPGTSYEVRVYGTDPGCMAQSARGLSSEKPLRVANAKALTKVTVQGEAGTLLDSGEIHFNSEVAASLTAEAEAGASCAATGPGTWLGLLSLLAMWVLLGRRPTAEIRVRASRPRPSRRR